MLEPSKWIVRWSHLLEPGCSVLDVACGSGRHLQWFAQRGHPVHGVDRNTSAAADSGVDAQLTQADIEARPWPLTAGQLPQQFGAVVVTNYLWRDLMPIIAASVAEGGVLLYETFASDNETVGKPSRPDFLLQPGELLRHFSSFHVVGYECGVLRDPDRYVQRIAAIRGPYLAATIQRRSSYTL
jgi:SAM-dependent methyltransferase